MRWLAPLILAIVFITIPTAYVMMQPLPNNWIPWKPVRLDEPPTLLAHFHIIRLRKNREVCVAALKGASRLVFSPQEDRGDGSCGFTNVVKSSNSIMDYNREPIATCGVTAALYWWQQELQGIAQEILQTKIARLDHLGTYACRNVNSATEGRRSQHATANAIDIEAFVMADGRHITVLKDWGKDSAEARFLRAAHASACGVFNGVLGPEYNALHANHFHLDLGPYLICR